MRELGDERQGAQGLGPDAPKGQQRLEVGGLGLIGAEQHFTEVARMDITADVDVVSRGELQRQDVRHLFLNAFGPLPGDLGGGATGAGRLNRHEIEHKLLAAL